MNNDMKKTVTRDGNYIKAVYTRVSDGRVMGQGWGMTAEEAVFQAQIACAKNTVANCGVRK